MRGKCSVVVALVATAVVIGGAGSSGGAPWPARIAVGGVSAASGGGVSPASGDFDGDGFDDAAFGTPLEDVGSLADAGNLTVVHGSATGLTTSRVRTFRQGQAPVGGAAEAGDWFGFGVAGDFDADGFDDLAVGAPLEDVGTVEDAGNVTVLYGGPAGLGGRAGVVLRQGDGGVTGAAETHDRFGMALAAADVDGDGDDDLAVGAPGESVGTTEWAGNVTILLGSPSGLTGAGSRVLRQGAAGVPGSAEWGDEYGATVVAGDVNGDGLADLAVGAPFEDAGTVEDTGNLTVSFSVPTGSPGVAGQVLTRGYGTAPAQTAAQFGASAAVGDATGDGFADVLVGTPGDGVDPANPDGLAQLFPGTAGRVAAMSWSISGLQANDVLGWAVALADADGDGLADAFVGAPNRHWQSALWSGAVHRCQGAASGVLQPCAILRQGAAFRGAPETGDNFAASLGTGDYDGDGLADVAVTAQNEAVGTVESAGNVSVGYGSATELLVRSQVFSQSSVGQTPEFDDKFGAVLG